MKKLSLLMAICLLVTVGGVYATWVYKMDTVASQKTSLTHEMEIIQSGGAAGYYAFGTNTMVLKIDAKASATDPSDIHTTDLKYNGSVTIIFNAEETAAAADIAKALNATISITAEDLAAAVYDSTPIWTVDTDAKITLTQSDWTQDGYTYSYTLNCAALADADMVKLSTDFELHNPDAYYAFQTAQSHAVFRVQVAPAA